MQPNSSKWKAVKIKTAKHNEHATLTFEYRKYFYGVKSNIDRKLEVENVNKIEKPNAFTRANIFN